MSDVAPEGAPITNEQRTERMTDAFDSLVVRKAAPLTATAAYVVAEGSVECEPGQWATVQDDTDEVLGCHDTREEAQAQADALMLAEAEAEAEAEVDAALTAAGTIDGAVEWHAVMIVEGTPTGDGRRFAQDALEWRDLPLPLMAQVEQPESGDNPHGMSVHVGAITRIERDGAAIHAWGVWDDADPVGAEYRRKVETGLLRGVSIDADDVTENDVELVVPLEGGDSPEIVFHHARIMGLTIVPFPAHPDAFIEAANLPAPAVPAEPASGPPAAAEPAAPAAAAAAAHLNVPVRLERAGVEYDRKRGEVVMRFRLEADEPQAVTAAAESRDGAMLALVPSMEDAQRLAVPGGLPPEELHVTLVFLGDATQVSPEQAAALHDWAAAYEAVAEPVNGTAFGVAEFNPGTPDACAVYVVGGDGDDLSEAHDAALEGALQVLDVPAQHDPWVPHLTIGYGTDPVLLDQTGPITFTALRVAIGADVVDHPLTREPGPGDTTEDAAPEDSGEPDALLAAAAAIQAPVHPPAAWLTDPHLAKPTALTVTDEGRVFGHIGLWGQCHVGIGNACVIPPSSASQYASFLTGELRTAEGTRVAVGHLTAGSGHAPQYVGNRPVGAAAAVEHYDHTGYVAADVTAGEDEHGIWVAGALRSDLTPEQLRAVMAAPPSGDWRKVNGALDLVAVAHVNVPGFPVARAGIHAGDQFALVAACVVPTVPSLMAGPSIADRIAATIGRTRSDRREALAARVHGG